MNTVILDNLYRNGEPVKMMIRNGEVIYQGVTKTEEPVPEPFPDPYGYLVLDNANANFDLGIYPKTLYEENNNYLKLEFDNTFGSVSTYLFSANSTPGTEDYTLSFEYAPKYFSGSSYCNVGSTKYILYAKKEKLNGHDTIVYNNGNITITRADGNSVTSAWTGNMGVESIKLFPWNGSTVTSFYYLKVFLSPSATEPDYYFYPAIDFNNNICIAEPNTKSLIYPVDTTGITIVKV